MYAVNKEFKCWMCGKIKPLTEHHVVPKILRHIVKGLDKYTVKLCKPCHTKVHILLPQFFSDGSYRWKGTPRNNVLHPEWEEWSKERIMEWNGNGKNGDDKK